MKVVIDIPENDYKLACSHPDALIACYAHYIKAGVPLPKNHGRLIDANALYSIVDEMEAFDIWVSTASANKFKRAIKAQPTIIEAEGE